jgi:hypothetical protein
MKKKKSPVCAIEVTDEQEMYLVFDGQRIARRNNKRWETIVPGYEVIDEEDGVLAVYLNDERLH